MSKHIHLAERSYKSDLDRELGEIAERIVREVLHSSQSVEEILAASLVDYSVELREP